MSLTSRERKMMAGIIVVAVIAAVLGAFYFGRSQGKETVGTTATEPVATQTTPTQTTATQTTPSQTTATTSTPSQSLELIERNVTPEVVAPGKPIVFTARVKGEAASVTMSIQGPSNTTVALSKKPTVDGVTIWSATTNAPTTPGVYRYYATATASDGTTVEMPGTSGWTFQVKP